MWLSSFAADATPELQVVRAQVWSIHSSFSSSYAACVANDALTLVTTSDVSLLRRLRVVHNSFVTLQFQKRSHIARLLLLSEKREEFSNEQHIKPEVSQNSDVMLSPLLAFNLGIGLRSSDVSDVIVSYAV